MAFESEHKTFNRQTNIITHGNIFANTQHGGLVRPYDEIECNGFISEKGHLQQFDFNGLNIPQHIRDKISAFNMRVWAYNFKHYNGNKRIDDGWIVTDYDHNLLGIYSPYYANWKQKSILEAAVSYITNEG